jgi:excisionase family DNA binding protein
MIGPYLTVPEVAALARCEHKTVRRAISDGRLRAFQPTHRVLIREDDAQDWIEGRAAAVAGKPMLARRHASRRTRTGRGSVADLKAIEQQATGP